MLIKELQESYKLENDEHDKIYNELKNEAINGAEKNKECNIIIGPRASGKSTLSKQLAAKGFALFDKSIIDRQHPDFETIKEMYPSEYIDIIAPDVVGWKVRLLYEMIDNGYNFNYETTGNNYNKLNDLISELKDNGYNINIFFMTINYLESKLRVYEDYIRDIERNIIGKPLFINSMASFANMPDLAEAMDFDDFKSVQFLSKDFAGCKFGSDKELFVNLMRDYNNDVSFIDFYKRAEYITNFIARYPELLKDVDSQEIFDDLNLLKYYYDTMSGNDNMKLNKTL